MRVDEEDPRPLSPARERELKARIADELNRADGVLVSDINKGLLTPGLLRALIDGANRRGIPIVIDPRLSEDFSIYRGATRAHAQSLRDRDRDRVALDDRDRMARGRRDPGEASLSLKACLITLDRDGMYLAERGGADTYIPTAPREVYDVTGAGDVVLTFFGLFAIGGTELFVGRAIANLAAENRSRAHRHRDDFARGFGASAASPPHSGYERKILSADELTAALDRDRRAGTPDRLYQWMLRPDSRRPSASARLRARAGRWLVVGLNSDRSVRALKGADRPINHGRRSRAHARGARTA